jgi:hypothetical protein
MARGVSIVTAARPPDPRRRNYVSTLNDEQINMALRAITDRRFYLRFLLIGLGTFAFALWALYDGYVAYPNQAMRAHKYIELVEADREDEWRDYAKEQGWPTANPGRPKGEADYIIQYIMAGGSGLVSLILITVVLRARGRWIELDGAQLTSSWGQTFTCDEIVSIDKKRWRDKGIARINYLQDGRKRRFVVDDFKFVRDDTDTILYEIEVQIELDRIIGGLPEPPPGHEETDAADGQEDDTKSADDPSGATTGDAD